VLRQLDKSNNNHIGYFNQNLFKFLDANWIVPKKGFDVVNAKEHIFVEMKNKHNTMNSSSSQKTYARMCLKVANDPNATCYLVEVIAKKSQNIEWQVRMDGELMSDSRIRRVSIDKFYEVVTGDAYAFQKLCHVLPKIIEDVLYEIKHSELIKNTVSEELQKIATTDLLNTIYKISFKSYQGFYDE
jgi:hypothetical protein